MDRTFRQERPKAPIPSGGGPAPAISFEAWLEASLLGDHPRMKLIRKAILRAAAEEWPVLLIGETGTGKDLAARAIHRASRRGVRLPEVVHVAGLGETCWSVLFGHRKGAFTGATNDHDGVFQVAHGSSVILEDVVDLPLRLQPILLRAIECGRFRPLGSEREVYSDVRIIATSNAALDREVEQGRFRIDLYERLRVLCISMPPLRDHLEDLRVYVPHFLRKAATAFRPPKRISDDGMKILASHSWPRNVRELEHLLYRASVEVEGDVLQAAELGRLLEPDSASFAAPSARDRLLDEAAVRRALADADGNRREAARRLSVSPTTFYKLLRQFELEARK